MTHRSTEQLFLTEAAKALLENQENSPFLNLARYQVWNITGRDSLQLVKRLFSDVVAQLAPFQSLDVIFTGYQYSALRLGEAHFRLGLYGELGDYGGLTFEQTLAQAQVGLQVVATPCNGRSTEDTAVSQEAIGLTKYAAIGLLESTALDLLPNIGAVKPPDGLETLLPNCAIPAEIDGMSVVMWRHQLLSQPIVELHAAVGDAKAIEVKLINIGLA